MTQTQEYLLDGAKIILDLCGGTGAWSKPYADAGYNVRVITLPEQNVIDYIPPANVYGILAAPPCTMFSLARSRAKTPRDFIEGMNLVNACYRIAITSKPVFFALENPIGLLTKFLGHWKYDYHPWWFGDPYTKRTGLWGWFNEPVRQFNNTVDVMTPKQIALCKTNSRKLPSISDITGSKQSARRAITPAGFAQAFFEANR